MLCSSDYGGNVNGSGGNPGIIAVSLWHEFQYVNNFWIQFGFCAWFELLCHNVVWCFH